MKFEVVNVRAIFVFHLTISIHVFRDGRGWYNFGKICLSQKICIFDALSSISIFKLGRLTLEVSNYRKWERIIFIIS